MLDGLAIIADDLTGANDVGIKLKEKGYEFNVVCLVT
jgi:uncharacterized protein YgbK (DUF1537 family)